MTTLRANFEGVSGQKPPGKGGLIPGPCGGLKSTLRPKWTRTDRRTAEGIADRRSNAAENPVHPMRAVHGFGLPDPNTRIKSG